MELPEAHVPIEIKSVKQAEEWSLKVRVINACFHRIADSVNDYLAQGGEVPDGWMIRTASNTGRLYLDKITHKNRSQTTQTQQPNRYDQ